MITTAKTFTVAFALVLCLASASTPNPCAFKLDGASALNCERNTRCAATFGLKRRAFCTKLPLNPGCYCPKIKMPVCCRVLLRNKATITHTEPNRCICECRRGKVLFDGECDKPPKAFSTSEVARCPRSFSPSCCYLPKFDLTFTVSNVCFCEGVFNGRLVDQFICGIKASA